MIWKNEACFSSNDVHDRLNTHYYVMSNPFRQNCRTFHDVLQMLLPACHLPWCIVCSGNCSPVLADLHWHGDHDISVLYSSVFPDVTVLKIASKPMLALWAPFIVLMRARCISY
ncbi:hypothetical protein AVEN_85980-1 [Araneus ventricosus]|uniref:Uncharacterized protein n=1 Tax=Araneus ventricosus TaxID=182803 RepID=A0A4Y2NX60_ARAVE|nr:hypothetical protein AVEN_85980-1 [Araneus ventricosus]